MSYYTYRQHYRVHRHRTALNIFLPSSTKLRRLYFYTCLSICSRGWGSAPLHAGIHPPGTKSRHPLDQKETPPPTKSRHPVGPKADTPPQDGYCCGRYASYWNALLLNDVKTVMLTVRVDEALGYCTYCTNLPSA